MRWFSMTQRKRSSAGYSNGFAETFSFNAHEDSSDRRLAKKAFRRQVAASVDGRRLVLFVHGYNVDWKEAKRWGEMVAGRIQKDAVLLMLSWPSKGRISAYLSDRAVARRAALGLSCHIAEATRIFAATGCSAPVAAITHSLGAYVLSKACAYAHEDLGGPRAWHVFSDVAMVNPDLDAEAFSAGAESDALAKMARRVTVYHSREDTPLLISSIKRAGITGARLGRRGIEGDAPRNVVSVDITARAERVEDHGDHSAAFYDSGIFGDILSTIKGCDRDMFKARVQTGENRYELV